MYARDLAPLLSYYRRVLRFELLHEVFGVLAIVRRGALKLQLWQGEPDAPRVCRVTLDGGTSVFRLYADLAGVARSALVEEAPRLRGWGRWEFSLCDAQGNRLVFSQSPLATPC
ncbi:MAG: hypothetical protein EOO29_20585 [Comamonadaceae bacterium]|nr:MAG: hypothetical protein EOO29_20585 [Comamonadaceae bacterium]